MTLDDIRETANAVRTEYTAPVPTSAGVGGGALLTEARQARDPLAVLKAAVEAASSFMGIGAELKKAGLKYHFSTEAPMPPLYRVTISGKSYLLVNKKYADKPDLVVGDVAIGVNESLDEESSASPVMQTFKVHTGPTQVKGFIAAFRKAGVEQVDGGTEHVYIKWPVHKVVETSLKRLISRFQAANGSAFGLRVSDFKPTGDFPRSGKTEETGEPAPADIIWKQLGRIRVMIGAKNPSSDKGGRALYFRIGRNGKSINWIRITLDPDDTYSLEFGRGAGAAKVISSSDGIHADQLKDIIARHTGMAASL